MSDYVKLSPSWIETTAKFWKESEMEKLGIRTSHDGEWDIDVFSFDVSDIVAFNVSEDDDFTCITFSSGQRFTIGIEYYEFKKLFIEIKDIN